MRTFTYPDKTEIQKWDELPWLKQIYFIPLIFAKNKIITVTIFRDVPSWFDIAEV